MNIVTPRLPASLAFLACCALLAAPPASAQLSENPIQHLLSANSHDVTVFASPFTSCRSATDASGVGVGVCSDGFPGPTATLVPVHPGGSVAIAVGAPTNTFTARYAATGGALGAELAVAPLDDSRQRFAVVLPVSPPADLLLVSTTYSDVPGAPGSTESGDAHFSIGLRVHTHPKPKPDGITANALLSCRTIASGGRRCRVSERGTIRRPVTSAADCRGGRVLVRVFVRGRRVVRATVPVTADCRYRLQGRSFSLTRGSTTAVIRTRFLGSSALAARSAPAIPIGVR
jgi:hypothetical protein